MEERQENEYLTDEESQLLWTGIVHSIERQERAKRRKRFTLTAVAIIAFLTLGSGFLFLYFQPIEYLATKESKPIILPDQTHVTLLKGSRLTLKRDFAFNNREVNLEGNAIFYVSKSKTKSFIVHGNGYDTKVHGTIFKVMQTETSFQVDLYEGSVSINQNQKKQEFALKPGQTFRNYGQKTIAAVIPTKGIIPSENPHTNNPQLSHLYLMNCPVSTAIPVLEKMTGKRINIPKELEQTLITVSLDKTDTDDLLANLADYLQLKIIKTEKGYELTR